MHTVSRAVSALAVEGLERAHLFAGVARRAYSAKSSSGNFPVISDDLNREFKRKFDPVAEEFREHRALRHPFYAWLEDSSKSGVSDEEYKVYAHNFLRRTELTIPSIARTVERAALSGDHQAVIDTVRNLNDESGYGDVRKMHSQLLLKSHNVHGMRVFGADPVDMAAVAESRYLVPEVEEYRRAKQEVFEKPYPFVAGNTWAHELAADGMLDNFRKAMFDPFKGYYTEEEYKSVMEFFTAHKDDSVEGGDVELQHERMTRAAAERACKDSLANIKQVREGGLFFLEHQARLWDGMLREMEKAKSRGTLIASRKPFIPVVKDAANTVVNANGAEEVASSSPRASGVRVRVVEKDSVGKLKDDDVDRSDDLDLCL